MFTRTSSSQGSPSPSSPSSIKPLAFPLRRKFHLGFLSFRISSLLRLLRSFRLSFRHALQALLFPRRAKKQTSSPRKAARVGLAFSAQCTRSACPPDAIADCLEFIKRSSSASSSSSSSPSSSSPPFSSPSSQPSSPSLISAPSSPSLFSLSSRLLSLPSQHSLLHHENSCSSSPLSHNYISLPSPLTHNYVSQPSPCSNFS